MFSLIISCYQNRYESLNTTVGLIYFLRYLLIFNNNSIKNFTYGEGSGRGSGRVGSDFLSAIAGRVGSGQRFAGSGRVGSKKSDPWTTLV